MTFSYFTLLAFSHGCWFTINHTKPVAAPLSSPKGIKIRYKINMNQISFTLKNCANIFCSSKIKYIKEFFFPLNLNILMFM